MGTKFEDLEKNSAKKLTGIGVVVFLHILVGLVLMAGMAKDIIKPTEQPVDLMIIQDIKPPEPEPPVLVPLELAPPEPALPAAVPPGTGIRSDTDCPRCSEASWKRRSKR